MESNPRKLWILLLAVFAVMLCAQAPALAQVISGDLVGTVLDASGAGVTNVTVAATNTATNITNTTTTGANGQYRISNLPPGNYDVKASASGFTAATLKGV